MKSHYVATSNSLVTTMVFFSHQTNHFLVMTSLEMSHILKQLFVTFLHFFPSGFVCNQGESPMQSIAMHMDALLVCGEWEDGGLEAA